MSHAKLSPSAAERWMTCPGSVILSEGMPDKSSKFAEEGTRAHEFAEQMLLGNLPEIGDVETYTNVMTYVSYVRSLGGKLAVEQKVKVNDQIYGTADAVVWQPEDQHLHIVDLKYGAGVAVEVVGNLQLKIYALATLLTFKHPAKQVTATIVQPRCPHGDGPVRSVTFDVVDLFDLHADLLEAVERVAELAQVTQQQWPYDALKTSEKGCRWCKAAPICPAQLQLAQDTAKAVFAPGQPYDPQYLSEVLDFLPIIEGWIKNTREFAYTEAEKGNQFPRWKLVEKRATRKWRNEGAAEARVEAILGEDAYEPAHLKTPAAIEKLLPKELRNIMDDLCVKESSGHALVHESDKRPAVALDAKSVFS